MSNPVTPEPTPTPRTPRPWYRRRWFVISAIVVVLFAGAAAGGIWWFLQDDAPAAVDLESATESLGDAATATTQAEAAAGDGAAGADDGATEADDTATPATTDSDTTVADSASPATTAADTAARSESALSGTWSVNTSIGEFSYEDSTGTFVGFRIEEELSGIGSTTAVGRTPTVTGTITIDGATLAAATIEADMTAITTNDNRRDDKVHSALETGEFPTATFTVTEPIDLGDAANTGAATTVEASGDLTVHGVTTPVTIPLEAQLVDGTIVVVGSLDVDLSTYDVEAPSAPIVASVSDQATIELQLFFSPAA
jgi:polyisoprenoid-binding protein YceI